MKSIYNKYGCFKKDNGFRFSTFAPAASEVLVVIDGVTYPMASTGGSWETFIEGVEEGSIYSYQIDGVAKADPFARKVISIAPKTLDSVIYDSSYKFKNGYVQKDVTKIFEVYLPEISGRNFQEKARAIVEAAKDYSHIQIMPFQHTPADITLGYKISSYFAPNAKYGNLDDFKELMDILHTSGFGVILDIVIFEFEEYTKKGLHNYDGNMLFNKGEGEQNDVFTGYLFDFDKTFVKNFMYSAIHFLIDELKADGVRMDGVNELIFKTRKQKEIDKKHLKYLQDITASLPDETIIIVDMLTHHSLEELELERISFTEGSLYMFQTQKILRNGQEWFKENREKEVKLIYKSLGLAFKNRVLCTINHDIHINGLEYNIKNNGLHTPEQGNFFKKLLYGVPTLKQLYQDVELDEKYCEFLDKIAAYGFSFAVSDQDEIVYMFTGKGEKFTILYNLFTLQIRVIHETIYELK